MVEHINYAMSWNERIMRSKLELQSELIAGKYLVCKAKLNSYPMYTENELCKIARGLGLDTNDVVLSVFILKIEDGNTRYRMVARSKSTESDISAQSVSMYFGGTGNTNEGGATVTEDPYESLKRLLVKTELLVNA